MSRNLDAGQASLRTGWLAFGYVLLACGVAAVAMITAATGRPSAAFTGDEGGLITHVFPGGPAWNSGVRVGQPLLSIEPGERPEDWRFTVDQGELATIGTQQWIDDLRATIPIAIASVVAALLALLVLGLNRIAALAIATGAIVLAEATLMAHGDRLLSTAGGAVGLLAPAVWLAVRIGRRPLAVMLAATAGLAAAWVAARFMVTEHFRILEMARVGATWGLLLVLVLATGWRDVWPLTGAYDRRRRTDALVLGMTVALAAGAIAAGTPGIPTLLIVLLIVAAYPVVRGRFLEVADMLAFGTVRERAALDAAEDERRRVAREIHDTAIQDLAALASRLERDLGPSGAGPASDVRDVTEQLRDITTRLASAELEDLGLGGALRGLVERADRPGEIRVRLELSEGSSGELRTIPDDVAVAVYRVAQEAIRNALRHSGGSEVVVHAALSPDVITLVVTDDGVGLDRVAVTAARARGHIGLATMRQRASSIDADLSVTGSDAGTRIALGWHR